MLSEPGAWSLLTDGLAGIPTMVRPRRRYNDNAMTTTMVATATTTTQHDDCGGGNKSAVVTWSTLKVCPPTFMHARIRTYTLTLFHSLRQMSWSDHWKVALAMVAHRPMPSQHCQTSARTPGSVIELCCAHRARRHLPMPRPAQHNRCCRLSRRDSRGMARAYGW
jgi:hypothetical protein